MRGEVTAGVGELEADDEAACRRRAGSRPRCRPPIASISARASCAPMPKPPSLVDTKGWNRRVRTKSAVMPQPWSRDLDHRLAARVLAKPISTGAPAGLASIAFWTRWRERLFERGRIGERGEPRVAGQRDRMRAAASPRRPRQQRLQRRPAAARPRSLRLGAGRKPGEQVVHLACTELCSVSDHVGAEFGIVGVALGIARDQAELADQILDVVEDEGEAAVELVEALRLGERLQAAAPRRYSSPPAGRRRGTGRNPPSRAAGAPAGGRSPPARPAGRCGSAECRPRPPACPSNSAGQQGAVVLHLQLAAADAGELDDVAGPLEQRDQRRSSPPRAARPASASSSCRPGVSRSSVAAQQQHARPARRRCRPAP